MPTLVLRFPGGRYHATPSGYHVNEGIVEWPPSPWRLVRALLACGYTTQRWNEVPPAGRRLFEALAATSPVYRLPAAALGHSRHYMPMTVLEKGREKTSLVFDTFADVGDGALWVRWAARLDPESEALFGKLSSHLGYLGRSESWVLGDAVSDDLPLPEYGEAFPHTEASRPGRGFEQISLSAPEAPDRYRDFRESEVSAGLAELAIAPATGKPSKKQIADAENARRRVEDGYPADLLACLQLDTAWWKARQWSQAPGSRRVLYWRRSDALAVAPPVAIRHRPAPPVAAMLLALTTPSGSRSALPTRARTVPQAELLHRALVSKLGFGADSACPELSGRDRNGVPLVGHQHAHVMPLDLDEDGRLDHVLVHAPMGFGPGAQRAIRGIKRTFTKGGVGSLQVALAGQGALDDLRDLPAVLAPRVTRLLGPRGGAIDWISGTPFVAPRHVKRRGANTLEGQVQAELAQRELPPARVEFLPWGADSLWMRHAICRRKAGAPQPAADTSYLVRLHFSQPVCGPLSLGYASHFGLGRFDAMVPPLPPR